MKQLEKYAAAQRALALMSRSGVQGRNFFQDLMKRQKGLNDFGPQSQRELIHGLSREPRRGDFQRRNALRTLKRLLRQGSSYADDSYHATGIIPRINNLQPSTREGPSRTLYSHRYVPGDRWGEFTIARDRLLRNRQRQLNAADDHAFALKQQQRLKRDDASEIERLLGKLG